jgi:hypothetical protein
MFAIYSSPSCNFPQPLLENFFGVYAASITQRQFVHWLTFGSTRARAKRRKNNAGGMKTSAARTPKQMGDRPANDRPDYSEHDCPNNRHLHVHDRFGDQARN